MATPLIAGQLYAAEDADVELRDCRGSKGSSSQKRVKLQARGKYMFGKLERSKDV
jgi:hypothetical protein